MCIYIVSPKKKRDGRNWSELHLCGKKHLETGNLSHIRLSLGDGSEMLCAHILTMFDLVQTLASRSNKEQRIGSLIGKDCRFLTDHNFSSFMITVTARASIKRSHRMSAPSPVCNFLKLRWEASLFIDFLHLATGWYGSKWMMETQVRWSYFGLGSSWIPVH